jgi:hypothetical protein
MNESDSPVLPYRNPSDEIAAAHEQPWWIGSLLCIFIVATSHYGLLELFGQAAFITTFGFLALGVYFGVRGIWKSQHQLWLSLGAVCLNIICLGAAVWMLIKK